MVLKGQAKTDYQREYMREWQRKRRAAMRAAKGPAPEPAPEPAKTAPPPPPPPPAPRRKVPEDEKFRARTAAEKARVNRLRVQWKKAGNMDRSYRISGLPASFERSRKYHADFLAEIAEERGRGKTAFAKWCFYNGISSPLLIAERSQVYKDTPELQEQFDLACMERIRSSKRAASIMSATTLLGLSPTLNLKTGWECNEYVEYLWKRLGRE
jgi:hypothetical protein